MIDRERVAAIALNQLAQNEEIPAERGEIRDINGVLLATSVEVQSVYAIPPMVERPGERGHAARLGARDGRRRCARPSRQQGSVGLAASAHRSAGGPVGHRAPYPRGRDAPRDAAGLPDQRGGPGDDPRAQLLGFVNVDGDGQYGVEGAQDALLAGLPGSVSAQEDVIGRRSPTRSTSCGPGRWRRPAADARRGTAAHPRAAMWTTYEKNHAHGVTGLVMDVHTGAIMAMASFPSFNANRTGARPGPCSPPPR